MAIKENYERNKKELLSDSSICKENRDLFKQFFEYEEYKLKRTNGLSKIDNPSYKTLYTYCIRLRKVNDWFNGKAWIKLTKEDIKKVYDDLEEGRIKNRNGEQIADRKSYYNKIMKSKPFKLAGKDTLAREVMEFYTNNHDKQVRFIVEQDFRKLAEVAIQLEHKLLLWLAWDIGENVGALLQLKKRDCTRQIDSETNQAEYLINLRKETLKRSRKARSELTNYKETVQLLDLILKDRKEDELIFNFGTRQAENVIHRASKITGVKVIPIGDRPKLKDLRSSMACDLLTKGWTSDEINSRLGHKASSRELDCYVNFLAIDKRKPQKKIYDNNLHKLNSELEEMKDREKLYQQRLERLMSEIAEIKKQITQ